MKSCCVLTLVRSAYHLISTPFGLGQYGAPVVVAGAGHAEANWQRSMFP